ncbi:hepatic lectin-like isoform X1 [Pelobates fuscus]|uniref:hepatic lectin-like isoform X1 n=2 Tax=Pelobates fuscus TaxID=191477 RepID=UPI002FE436E2
MDSERSIANERLYDTTMYSGSTYPFYRKYSMVLVTYGLIAFLYILILALFIIILSKSKPDGLETNINIQREISAFRNHLSQLTSKLNQMEGISYKAACETSWIQFNDSCYQIITKRSNWINARALCLGKGSDLVVITSQEEQNFLMSNTLFKNDRFWIGLSIDIGKQWQWVDATNYGASYKSWKKGEPRSDRGGFTKNCAFSWTNSEWDTVQCAFDKCFAICEKKLG